jgi:hypothetical protein
MGKRKSFYIALGWVLLILGGNLLACSIFLGVQYVGVTVGDYGPLAVFALLVLLTAALLSYRKM